MRYIKYCSEKYHPKNSNSEIQIGTLNYYRKSDNKFIADPSEGRGGYFQFRASKDIEFSRKEVEWLSNGGIFGGGMKINKGGTLNLNFEYEVPNSYLYCCSIVDKPSLKQAKELGYDSYYEIINIEKFMEVAWSEMINLNKAKIKEKGHVRSEILNMHGKIDYAQKKDIIFHDYVDIMSYLLFTKPQYSPLDKTVCFKDNSEYRLTWLLKEKDKFYTVEVENNPIRISSKKLLPYISWGEWK